MIYPAKTIQKSGACAIKISEKDFYQKDGVTPKEIVFAQLAVPATFENYENDYNKNVTFIDEVALFKNEVYKNEGMKASVRLGFQVYFAQLITSLLETFKDDLEDYGIAYEAVKIPFNEVSLFTFVKVPDHLISTIENFVGENEKLEAVIRPTFYYQSEKLIVGCSLTLIDIRPLTAKLQKVLHSTKPIKPKLLPGPIEIGVRPPNGRRPLREIKPKSRNIKMTRAEEQAMFDAGEPYTGYDEE
jgi:hypothetical protein